MGERLGRVGEAVAGGDQFLGADEVLVEQGQSDFQAAAAGT